MTFAKVIYNHNDVIKTTVTRAVKKAQRHVNMELELGSGTKINKLFVNDKLTEKVIIKPDGTVIRGVLPEKKVQINPAKTNYNLNLQRNSEGKVDVSVSLNKPVKPLTEGPNSIESTMISPRGKNKDFIVQRRYQSGTSVSDSFKDNKYVDKYVYKENGTDFRKSPEGKTILRTPLLNDGIYELTFDKESGNSLKKVYKYGYSPLSDSPSRMYK